MAQQQWDESGKPIPAAQQQWDEQGRPVATTLSDRTATGVPRQLQATAAQADPRTGQGMMERSQLQARETVEQPINEAVDRQTKLGERMNRASRSATPFTNAASAVMAPEASLRMLAGSKVGSKVGGTLGERMAGQRGREYGTLAGGVVGSIGMPSAERLSQIEPITPTQFKPSWAGGFGLKLRDEPPPEVPPAPPPAPAPPTFPGASSSSSPVRSGPYSELPPVPQGNPTPFPTVPPRTPPAQPTAGAEPLVQSPEDFQSGDFRQRIAERLARERGNQYAGGVRTAGPNKPANRLFPRRQQ